MNLKDKIEITIVDMAKNGSGIGKYKGITVFVDGALVGDEVVCEIIKKKKTYLNAKLLKVTKPSPKRTEPICPISHLCGGCQIMQLAYPHQLQLKENTLIENLKRIGEIENPPLEKMIAMEEPYFYRNKIQIPIGKKDGEPVFGFYKKRSHDIVPFDKCYIQKDINEDIIKIVKEYISRENISIYDEKTKKGTLRHLVVRVGHHTGEVMVILVTNQETRLKGADTFIKYLTSKIKNTVSIVQNINTKNTNVIMGKESIVLYGKDHIIDTISGLKFKIGPNNFYQVNSTQMEKLYSKTFEYAGDLKDKVVYDLYCGIGTISLLAAKRAKRVYAIEANPSSIDSANENKRLNNIENVHFITGKVEHTIQKLSKEKDPPQVIILDPARAGAERIVLDTIKKLNPEKIIYISCNPATLSRDLKVLLEDSHYELKKATPVDMFPHTMHVETVVLMSRIDGD